MQNWNTITVLQSGSCTTKKNIYIQVLVRSLRQSHTHIHTCTHTHTHTRAHTHTHTHTHTQHTHCTHTNAIYIHTKHTYEDTHLLFLAGRAWFWTLPSSEPSWASRSLHLNWDWRGRDQRWGSSYNRSLWWGRCYWMKEHWSANLANIYETGCKYCVQLFCTLTPRWSKL